MYELKEFHDQLRQRLLPCAETSEATLIANWLLEHYLDVRQVDILLNKKVEIAAEAQQQLRQAVDRLNCQEPLQYVLGEAYFYGRVFTVSPAVLIPRRETEELVAWVVEENKDKKEKIRVLDIGTGSGCIAVTLSQELCQPLVYALDSSEDALRVATENALLHGASVTFWKHDILCDAPPPTKPFDIIVSNPPYVLRKEAQSMSERVIMYEPSEALFVDDPHPLLFYERIVYLCQHEKWLATGGRIYWEINEVMGDKLLQLLYENRFEEVCLRKDMQGKHRFITGKLVE